MDPNPTLLLKGFKDEDLTAIIRIIRIYKNEWHKPERLGPRKGVVYKSALYNGSVYIYHTKTQIVARPIQ